MASTPIYVHSPGAGPYSLRSLTQRQPRRRVGIPDLPPGHNPPAVRRPAAPPTDAQLAQSQVSAAFDPVLKQITEAFNQRATAQQSAITGYSKTLADLMGSYGPQAQQAYSGAAAGQGAIDASLAATREGQGAGAQAALAAKLAEIHASPETASRISGGLSRDFAGEAQATAGRGAANLSQLLGEGAHAQDYGAKLPGIAAGMGLGATQRAQGQITTDLKAALSELAAKRPDAYQAALSNISTTRQRQEQINLENRLANKKFGLETKKTNASIRQGDKRLTIEETNALTSQQNANTSAANATTSQQNADTSAAAQAETARHNQATEKAAKAAHKAGGLTPYQSTEIAKAAAKDAEDLYHGVTKPNPKDPANPTVVSYTETYQDAVKTLTKRYPTLGRAGVLALVNSWYKPGEYGRPGKTAPIGSAGAPGPVQGTDYRNGS